VKAMSTELWLEYMAIRVDSKKAKDINFIMNLIVPDNDEKFIVEVSNATMTSFSGATDPQANITVNITREDLEAVMMGEFTLMEQIYNGGAMIGGNIEVVAQLEATLTDFDPIFEIMPGTSTEKETKKEEQPAQTESNVEF